MRSRPVYLLHAASAMFLLLAAAPASAIIINNGLAPPNPANVINTVIPESVLVYDSGSGAPTTVELVDGGQVGDVGLERFEVFDSSNIQMSGGYVSDDIFTHDSATLFMTGGLVNSGVLAFDSSALFVSGGTIESGLWVQDFATALISGGSVVSVTAAGAIATVTGGSDLASFSARGEGTINIVGGSFIVNGIPVGFGEIPASFGKTGTLTGVLQSGEAFNASFTRAIDTGDPDNPIITGRIVLVPEPSTALLLALGLVGITAGRRRGA